MSGHQGDVQLDVDAPIPYVLTDKARRELQQWREDENFPECPHDWQWERGRLRCQNCSRAQPVPARQSIPSYLGGKAEWKRA